MRHCPCYFFALVFRHLVQDFHLSFFTVQDVEFISANTTLHVTMAYHLEICLEKMRNQKSVISSKYLHNTNGIGDWLSRTNVIIVFDSFFRKSYFYSSIVFHCFNQPTTKPVHIGCQPVIFPLHNKIETIKYRRFKL